MAVNLNAILRADAPHVLARVPHGAMPLVLADLARAQRGRIAFVASDDVAMHAVVDTIAFFAPEIQVVSVPAWDCLPYDRASPSLAISAERWASLHALQSPPNGPQLVITTANAWNQRTLTPFRIRNMSRALEVGHEYDRDNLIALLVRQGYVRTDTVADAGEFAVRGNLIDIYPAGLGHGLRLDFFGDELETLRSFDVSSQRSSGSLKRHLLLPASEAILDDETIKAFRSEYRSMFGANATGDPLYKAVSEGRRISGIEHWIPLLEGKLAHLSEHFEGAPVFHDNGVIRASEERFDAITDYYSNRKQALERGDGIYRPLPPKRLYVLRDEWQAANASLPVHRISENDEPEGGTTHDFGFANARDFTPERVGGANLYDAAARYINHSGTSGKRTVIAAASEGSRQRMTSLLNEHGLKSATAADNWQQAQGYAAKGHVAMVVLPLDHGFDNGEMQVITEQDLLGDRMVRRKKRRKSSEAFLAEISSLEQGDLVVHVDHGIGRYEGLTSIPVGQSPHDCVALSYAGKDKLYVPVENIDVLTRYGSDAEGVALDRLGGEAWQRKKAQLKERINEIAGQLMKTAADRALRAAEAIDIDTSAYASFTDRFPYQETEDQERVIAEVLEDLSSGKPMDRLVCGDVGFGKTEVAMRAAFGAAMSGMQVAIVAPTTLLARQHYTNFVERFDGFPLKIGRLSRLVPAKEASSTRDRLTDGTVDIVVGTHALLSKTVKFKRLGLVIVDEEQRFGVLHKERLKELKADVHMLTLTATPIPRTLQMAMSGLRELSVIQTPPVDRLSVRSYVMPWDPMIVREALLREHYRGGQSFFVAPRIADLAEIEKFLREAVPEVKFVTAHGQMSPTEVEERMSAFYDHEYDVLLSTTIVESGLDIPSANTLIIHRADRFGLAQLYQLRGRVGRSKQRAFAYFTTPEDTQPTEAAEKRLKVLGDLDSLGAGFQLAAHDLDIRGAGNLVGDEQSGHIREVGFELYQSMLEDAILAAKAGKDGLEPRRDSFSPQITVDAPILIPETYVPDLAVRMGLYRRLNDAEDGQALESLSAEIIDRFGPLPSPTENLIKLIRIKLNCIKACVSKIEVGPRAALITFHEDRPPSVEGLLGYVERLKGTARLRPDGKLVIDRAWRDPQSRLNGLTKLSQGLAGLAKKAEQAA